MGAISFPDPFRRLSVPPLAGLEGQGCGALGCRGAEGGLLSALPQRSSSFQCSHPNAFLQPHLHHGGCSGGGHLRLNCQGCCGACSTPFSRLLQLSVRSVEDLGVMASGHRPLHRFVDLSPFHMETIQSVLLSVRQGDWMASIHLKEASLQAPVHPASRHFLRFMFRDTVYHFKALCFGLSTAPQVFTRVMTPVSAILHSLGFRMSRYHDDWLAQSASRESFLRDLQAVLQLCHELGIVVKPQEFQPGSITGGSVSGGYHRLHLFQGFSVGGAHLSAAVNSRRVSVLRLASRELMALATRRTFFAGSPSSWRQTEDAVPPALPPSILGSSGSGGSSVCVDGVSSRPPVVAPSPLSVSRSVSLPRCLQTYTSGQTPQTWGGVPISIVRLLQACGTPTRRRYP